MLFEINRANLRHAYGPDGAPKRTFRQLGPQDPALADCRTLHAARPLHVIREPERFLDILKSWDSQAWVIAREDVFEGYLVASKDGAQVHELVLANPRDSADIVAAWARDRDLETVNVLVPPYDPQVILPLSRLAETMRVEAADNLAVFRFDTTVNAFFKLKATYDALPDGEVVIAVDGHPPFRMSAVDGAVRAEMTQAPAHLAMTYADALALLFSPLGGVCAAALEDGVREGRRASTRGRVPCSVPGCRCRCALTRRTTYEHLACARDNRSGGRNADPCPTGGSNCRGRAGRPAGRGRSAAFCPARGGVTRNQSRDRHGRIPIPGVQRACGVAAGQRLSCARARCGGPCGRCAGPGR